AQPGRRQRIVIHLVRREEADLEPRRAGIEEPRDALPGRELAALRVPLAGRLGAAEANLVGEPPELRGEPEVDLCVALEVVGARIDLRPEYAHLRPRTGRRDQLAADQHAADLVRAGADLVQLRVAPEPSRRILGRVAVAAERLHGLARDPGRRLGRLQDR